ncbi:MAG: NAD(P)-dependent oxidoreductase [Deltaproteobacteria bacterium]|nr:NAD(P)-dependent oxidoreductase [Deltaproteobacteria bacterium]
MTTPGKTSIGFIGLGVMGQSMARNLLKAGFPLTVHNRSRGKVEELVKDGARAAETPAELARAVAIVILCLPDTPDVEKVLFGPQGVAEGAHEDLVVVDTSSISATATIEFAARLKTHGVAMVDSPVSGGPKAAVDGTLSCMLGGDASVIAGCMPVLQTMGKTFVHLGPVGAGQLVKACNQLVIAATLMGASEAIALCRKYGVDPVKMREALLAGSARSFVLENHAKRILDQTLAPGFRAALMHKDMKLAMSAGRDAGVFMPATALGVQLFGALCNTGRDGLDSASLGLLVQELSGIRG